MLSEAIAEAPAAALGDQSPSSTPTTCASQPRKVSRGWLAAALLVAVLFTWRGMFPAFGPGQSVQDDARQHVFWMARFQDPALFPNDPIADYYQALAPPGYVALYRVLSQVMDPLLVSKLLPPVLGLITALFTFLFALRLQPSPIGAFLAAVLVSWYFWPYDDLVSATPRAFLAPLLATQLWALASGRQVLAVGLAVLGALLYPIAGALMVALLGAHLVGWSGRRPLLIRQPSRWATFLAAALLVGLVLLPSQRAATPYGPPISGTEARTLPDFREHGRLPFFVDDPYKYWLTGQSSGFDLRLTLPMLSDLPALYVLLALSLMLPRLARRLPEQERLSSQAELLPQLLLASCGLFIAAHVLLFQLYVPSRYVKWSVPLVLSVAGGLALGLLIEAAARRLEARRPDLLAAGLALGLAFLLAMLPVRYFVNWKSDQRPEITDYVQAQPIDLLVAAAPLEADSLSTFARRRVLTDREHLYAWHWAYFDEMRRRTEDLVAAYYAETPGEVADFADRYGVDLILVNRRAYNRAEFGEVWGGFYPGGWEPYSSEIARRLETTQHFALLELASRCATVDDGRVAAIPVSCLRNTDGS